MKKILFFTYDFPFPTNSGGKNRAYHLMKHGGSGVEIHLFSFTRGDFKEEYKKELEKIGVKNITLFPRKNVKSFTTLLRAVNLKHSVFHSLYFEKTVFATLLSYVVNEKINVVHFESFYTGFYITSELTKLGVRQVFGTENVEYKVYEEYATYNAQKALKPVYINQVKRVKKEESQFAELSDVTLAVTKEEEEYFKSCAKKTEIIQNGIDISEFKFKPNLTLHGTKLLFVGNFTYFPNRDAIHFFYNDVFVNLQGNYTLTVIGKGVKQLGIDDLRVVATEFISDICDAYYDADVMVSPIRIGGGTNFKLLEAAACGVPIIAHGARVKSIGFTPDEDILVAGTGQEFLEKTEKLLNNDALQGKLAKNARAHIEKNYSWKEIGKHMNKIWKEL